MLPCVCKVREDDSYSYRRRQNVIRTSVTLRLTRQSFVLTMF